MPKVSVVISTYNRPERLKKAIESVIAQTYPDWELIIVDDASTSKTADAIASFTSLREPQRVYIRRPENFGSDTAPKNRGILESKGDYIAFLDDDNTWRPDHLAALVAELERNPDIDLVYGDRWAINEEDETRNRLGIFSDFNPSLLLNHNYIDTSDALVRRQALFDVGGFDERYKKFVDWNLWLRMAKAGKRFKRVPLILTDYHLHPDSKSHRPEDQKAELTPAWDPYDLEIELPYLGEVREPRVAIYSITYDRLEYTKKCFESLYKTAGYEFDHFVVDNGSTDGTVEWLRQEAGWIHPDHLVLNLHNVGISHASNQALDAILESKTGDVTNPPIRPYYDIIIKVDNDCLFLTDGWLKKMVEIWKSNHMMALSCYVQGLRDNPGGAPRIGYGKIKGELIGMTKHIGGICCFTDASAYEAFRFDEMMPKHGMQDLESSQNLIFKGFQMGYLENYYCSHGPQGTEQQQKDFPDYFERRQLEKTQRYEAAAGSKQ